VERQGRPLVLSEPASYDINQTLIPYTSRSTHFEAAIVGLLNTLLVAVCGIATCQCCSTSC
jgi:general L-amino acid transport system permease protein